MIIIIQFLLLHHLNIEICHKFFFYSTSGTLLFIIILQHRVLCFLRLYKSVNFELYIELQIIFLE